MSGAKTLNSKSAIKNTNSGCHKYIPLLTIFLHNTHTLTGSHLHKIHPSHTCHHTHPIELVVEPARVTDGVSIFCSPPKNSLHGATIGTLVIHALQRGFL